MKLHAKVVATMWQRPIVALASALATNARLGAVLLKFTMSENHQAVLQEHKGSSRTKLGLDEDLTPMQEVCKSELRPLFKEAKATSKHAF
jgi:hypothetical protein